MKQGVLTNGRVKLLLKKGNSCFRPRRTGQRRRKSVRGCIVDSNLSVLNLVIVKKGETELPGLTDKVIPRRLGPKRVGKIRKMYNLDKKDDVRSYIFKSQGGQAATLQGSQDSAVYHSSQAAEEASHVGLEEEEGRKGQAGGS